LQTLSICQGDLALCNQPFQTHRIDLDRKAIENYAKTISKECRDVDHIELILKRPPPPDRRSVGAYRICQVEEEKDYEMWPGEKEAGERQDGDDVGLAEE
jgi:hypothetical protein